MLKPLQMPCEATTPWAFKPHDYWHVTKDVIKQLEADNVAIIAAGVAFFTMLAIFPLITACLSIYGYVADPTYVQDQLNAVSSLLPTEAWKILDSQIIAVANAPDAQLGLGIAVGLIVALWSAGAGIRAIMRAMNIAYDEKETRGIAKFYALAASFTLSVTIFMWVSLAVIIGVPALLAFLKLEGVAAFVTRYIPWILVISMFAFSVGVLYLLGPSRRRAKIRWVIPGVIFATLFWVLISAGFSRFVAAFGTYNKTYGSISAVIILLIWFWLTSLVIIVGAEINAAMERHTSADTTRGPDRPIGKRGAKVADVANFPI